MEKNNTNEIVTRLKKRYPEAECSLAYDGEPYKLLIMSRLSAQCTDARVNSVCGNLFERYRSIEEFAGADVEELEKYIFSCGLYKTKARDIKNMCIKLVRDFGGKVPDNIDSLLTLDGVGRKIANLIIGDIFGGNVVVTDTHCIRISNRLGLADSKNPVKVEKSLLDLLPEGEATAFCHRLVFFGRDICTARSPKCPSCPLADLCPSINEEREDTGDTGAIR